MTTDRNHTPMSDAALDKLLLALPKELPPTRELWPALEARLVNLPQSGRNVQRWKHVWPVAGVALAAVWFLFSAQTPQQRLPEVMMTSEMMLMQIYEQQKAQQIAALGHFEATTEDWSYPLSVLDTAVTQVRSALSFYPDEPVLLRQLDRLYRQQLQYLQQIALTETTPSVFYPGATP